MTPTEEAARRAAKKILNKWRLTGDIPLDQLTAIILSKFASLPSEQLATPHERYALSGECDNDAHSSCPYPDKCRCACHRPEGLSAKGDERCERCGHVNDVPWFAPSPIWNKLIRANSFPEMICPMCFMQLAEIAGFKTTGWELSPESLPSERDAGLREAADICRYYCEEDGDIASQAEQAIRRRITSPDGEEN